MSGSLYQTIVEKYQHYIMPTYAPKTLLVRGEGAWLYDADNRRYLDFACGIRWSAAAGR